jgi:hypothetical protein
MTSLMAVRGLQTMCFNVYISAYILAEHYGCEPGFGYGDILSLVSRRDLRARHPIVSRSTGCFYFVRNRFGHCVRGWMDFPLTNNCNCDQKKEYWKKVWVVNPGVQQYSTISRKTRLNLSRSCLVHKIFLAVNRGSLYRYNSLLIPISIKVVMTPSCACNRIQGPWTWWRLKCRKTCKPETKQLQDYFKYDK